MEFIPSADPVSTGVNVVSAVATLGKLFGGGGSSKPPAQLMGFDVEGTVRATGFEGSVTAYDQYGVRWNAAPLGNDIRPYATATLAKLGVPTNSQFSAPISYSAKPMEGQGQLINGITTAIEAAWSKYKEGTALDSLLLPSASSFTPPGGSPVQPGTPAGAVPVGGIAASAAPASSALSGLTLSSPIVIIALLAGALVLMRKRG